MNFKVLWTVSLCVGLLLSGAEGWGGRRRRRIFTCPNVCTVVCIGSVCSLTVAGVLKCYTPCKEVCKSACGKREIQPGDATGNVQGPVVKLIPRPLPNKFSQYDVNKDGRISYEEFENALPHVRYTKVIRKGFKAIDKNGDKHISCDEFLNCYLNTPKAEKC